MYDSVYMTLLNTNDNDEEHISGSQGLGEEGMTVKGKEVFEVIGWLCIPIAMVVSRISSFVKTRRNVHTKEVCLTP